jgi:hypothetical protein
MAQREMKVRSAGGAGPSGRPPLEPADPLPLSTALIQVALLLGIPIVLLLLAKVILTRFFPGVAL